MMPRIRWLCMTTGLLGTLACTGTAPISPLAGFTNLFNGHDLTGWRYDGSGHWGAENNLLVYDGGGWQPYPDTVWERNLHTEKEYGDFILLIDWKIEKDGNSGIFLRAAPETPNILVDKGYGTSASEVQVEIWDRTAVVYSSLHGSGGVVFYNSEERIPLRTADHPLGEWNHFEIRVEGDLVTVRLNDELVLDKYAADFQKPRGSIILQHHGSPLWFKNIYLKELKEQ